MNVRLFPIAIMAACVWAPTLAAADDAWTMVPALATACYQSEDQWGDTVSAAIDSVNQAMYQQDDVNAEIHRQSTAALSDDPFAMAQRMQQAMMDDPASAQKMMQQAMQAQEEGASEKIVAQHEKETQFEAESNALGDQYRASLARAMEPAEARWRVLADKLSRVMVDVEFGNSPTPGWPDSAIDEWREIQKERNKAYVANCATWWAKAGPIHAYLSRYKSYLVQERIPYEQRLSDDPELHSYAMLGVSTEGWRTTTDYKAAHDYMRRAEGLFYLRDEKPRCTSPGVSDDCLD